MGADSYLSLIFSLIGVVAVLAFTFYGSKWVRKRYTGAFSGSKYIKIIDRVTIGQDTYIIIADICNSKCIIGVSGQQITLLKDLGEIEFEEEPKQEIADFKSIFGDMLKNQIHEVKDKYIKKGGGK